MLGQTITLSIDWSWILLIGGFASGTVFGYGLKMVVSERI